jgi:glucan phosphoethanolaminetransferase (alkaline phosphatase superfamily)
MKNKKWMNEKGINELKKTRGFLHRMSISSFALFLVFMTIFLYTWCFTTEVLVPFVSVFMTVLAAVFMVGFKLRCDHHSMLIYIKEATDEVERKP